MSKVDPFGFEGGDDSDDDDRGGRRDRRDRDRDRDKDRDKDRVFRVDERVAVRNDTKAFWRHGDVVAEGRAGADGARVQLPSEKRDSSWTQIGRLPSLIIIKHAGDLSGDYILQRNFEGDYSVWQKESAKDPPCLYYREKNEQWALAKNARAMEELDYELLENVKDGYSKHPGDPACDGKWVDREQRTQRDIRVEPEKHWHPPKWAKSHPDNKGGKRRDSSSSDSRGKGKRHHSRRRRRHSSSSGSDGRRKDKDKKDRRGKKSDREPSSAGGKRDKLAPVEIGQPGDLHWMGEQLVVLEEHLRRARAVCIIKAGSTRSKEVDEEKITGKACDGWTTAPSAELDLGGRGPRGQAVREGDGTMVLSMAEDEKAPGPVPPWATCFAPDTGPQGLSLWRLRVERAPDWAHAPKLDPASDEPGSITAGLAPADGMRRRARDAGSCAWDALPAGSTFFRNPRRLRDDSVAAICVGGQKGRGELGALREGDDLRVLVDRTRRRAWFIRGWDSRRSGAGWELAEATGLPADGDMAFFVCIAPGSRLRLLPPLLAPGGWANATDLSRLGPPSRTAVRDLVFYLELLSLSGGDRAPGDAVQAASAIAQWAVERETRCRHQPAAAVTRALPDGVCSPSYGAVPEVWVVFAATVAALCRRPFDANDRTTWRWATPQQTVRGRVMQRCCLVM
eukprot:TRINITY_DN19285_c0_g1_i2.p1 TRINITY_DN19285_c0_g1~~TRINITY_DN19285_c0_g1_i2.p1  ORF type:complete len:714 (+),score=234.55 TRINITY_DN19285_c0_g1_i2:106-2142(+)